MTAVNGSVALVTGAGGGIGRAIVDRLRAAGALVVTADLPNVGADLAVDVTDDAALDAAVATVVHEHGRLDLAVASAGIGVAGRFNGLDADAWRRCLDVNVLGTANLFRAAWSAMVRGGGGHLVAIASLAGLVPTPLLVPYAASKGAVVSLVTSLRPEAARHRIGVSAVCPGPVDTALLDTGGRGGVVHHVDVRRFLTAAAGPAITPDRVARATERAIRADRAVVAPGRAAALWRATRLSPGAAERIISRVCARELALVGDAARQL